MEKKTTDTQSPTKNFDQPEPDDILRSLFSASSTVYPITDERLPVDFFSAKEWILLRIASE